MQFNNTFYGNSRKAFSLFFPFNYLMLSLFRINFFSVITFYSKCFGTYPVHEFLRNDDIHRNFSPKNWIYSNRNIKIGFLLINCEKGVEWTVRVKLNIKNRNWKNRKKRYKEESKRTVSIMYRKVLLRDTFQHKLKPLMFA